MTYTVFEIAGLAKVSPQRVNQWRTNKSLHGFKLTKGKDWKWIDGKIVYTESALKKIQSKKIYKERK